MRLKGRLDKESKKATYDVLVYDSGVGGLSIAREIRRHLPAATLLYVSDSAAFPYGTKEADWLVERVHKVLTQVLTRYQPRTFVMACNTASTIVLPSIRGRYPQPVVGVVPAIKPAALLSQKNLSAYLPHRRPFPGIIPKI